MSTMQCLGAEQENNVVSARKLTKNNQDNKILDDHHKSCFTLKGV